MQALWCIEENQLFANHVELRGPFYLYFMHGTMTKKRNEGADSGAIQNLTFPVVAIDLIFKLELSIQLHLKSLSAIQSLQRSQTITMRR